MGNAIELKKAQVAELKEKIENSAATVIVKYEGLTVEEISTLREELRKEEVDFKVIKNNISSKAFEAANIPELGEYLVGPTAVAFSKEDVTAAARILNNFAKEHQKLELRAGSFDGNLATPEQIKELALLPNKEGMLSMLLSVLQAPMRGLAQTISQIAEQKEQGE